MHPLLARLETSFISPEHSSAYKARAALYAAVLAAPTLAEAAQIARLEPRLVRWTGEPYDATRVEGWRDARGDAESQRLMAACGYRVAQAYAAALPRLRCAKRRERALFVIEQCACAIEQWQRHVPEAQSEADAAEIRALLPRA
jgi:hypothetical protein